MRIFKFVWVTLALLVLLTGHLKRDAGANRDLDIVTLAAIGFLGFPGGYVGLGVFGWLCLALRGSSIEIPASHQMYWGWLVSVACGYVQWFIAVPWLGQQIRNRSERRRSAHRCALRP